MKKNPRIVFVLAACLAIIGLMALTKMESKASAHAPAPVPGPRSQPVMAASPGRIEGRSEVVEVGAGIDGIVAAILVAEGQKVRKGDVVARLNCADLERSLEVSRAEVESLKQSRTRLVRGSRDEEREAAAQKTAAARAVRERASTRLDRMTQLHEAAAISREAFDDARRDFEVAQADLKQAMRNQELVEAGPLQEEVARADADVLAAEHRVSLAAEKLGKCEVRAPLDGTVLRVNLRAGESFALLSPRPILAMADLSGRRVRAEVDERDVQAARSATQVIVTSESSGEHRFAGRVIRVSPSMGRKSVLTGEPADKKDRDVLEVLAELEPEAAELPVGLRVTVKFTR